MTKPTGRYDDRGLPPGYAFRPEWEVTPRYVAEHLAAAQPASGSSGGTDAAIERMLLIDCRRDEEIRLCRIDGSTWVPMHDIERRLDELEHDDEPANTTAPNVGPRGHEIVVYCHHGARSLRVAATLRGHGFANVKSMAGGIEAWSVAIDPTVPRY